VAANGRGWTQRAAVAHAVYAPEVRHPVEVNVREGDAAQQREQEAHLSRWLTRRLAVPVKLFDLRDQGFELVGGRLLPDAAGPSAQLMYQDAMGVRVTVYLRKAAEHDAPAAFSYQRQGDLGMFYWVEGRSGYALVGSQSRERLLALALAIAKQDQAPASAPAR
jgi:anti-sigma factor RsiW